MSFEAGSASQRGVRGALGRVFGQRAQADPPGTGTVDLATPSQPDAASVQIMAHTLIADLFGVGLRLQNVRGRVAEELQRELDEITDQVDKVVRDVRDFAFLQRAGGADSGSVAPVDRDPGP